MSYWSPDNKVDIGEQISITVRSDQSLNYGAGNVIKLDIPSNIEFIDPKNTYLNFEVKLQNTIDGNENCRIMLDHKLGGQVLIKNCTIYCNNGQTLVEQIEDYNRWVSIIYDYEDNEILRQRRGQTEGAIPNNKKLLNNNDQHSIEPELNDCLTNPYFKNETDASFTNDSYIKAKVSLRLHTGLFGNDHIIPNKLLNGLTLHLELENNIIPYEALHTVNYWRSGDLYKRGMRFYGQDDTGAVIATNDAVTELYFTAMDNSIATLDSIPFRVGDAINLTKSDKSSIGDWKNAGGDEMNPIITALSLVNNQAGTIQLIKVEITEAHSQVVADIDNDWYAYILTEKLIGISPTFTVSNVDLIVQECKLKDNIVGKIMKSIKENKSYVYDITSIQNYRYSALKGDVSLNMRIPIQNKRAFSLLSMPTDGTIYTALQKVVAKDTYYLLTSGDDKYHIRSSRSGLVGIADHVENYQYFYEKLQPSRPVNVASLLKDGIPAPHLGELDKALKSAGIMPLSMAKYKDNFIIGRQFAKNGGVYNPTGKDFNLMVNYTTAGLKDKLWMNFCVHNRKININADGSVIVDI